MSDTIFLRVGNQDRIPFSAFIESLRNFLLVLKDLDATISQDKYGSAIWEVVSLQKNILPIVGVAPKLRRGHTDVSGTIEEQLIANTKSLSYRGERNQYMSDAALTKVENLAKLTPRVGPMAIYLNGNGEGHKKKEADITENTLNNVRQLTGVKYHAYGSIVGSLDAISVHKANEFRVWDEITNKPVRCKFNDSELDRVKSLLKTRVVVFGDVQSNSSGNPVVISVEELESSPKPQLPTIEEMSGLVEDFTGGKSLKEYMEELSNE